MIIYFSNYKYIDIFMYVKSEQIVTELKILSELHCYFTFNY